MEKMVSVFLDKIGANPDRKVGHELEVRFGTNYKKSKPLSKLDYDATVKQLYAAGFTTVLPEGLHMLRIQHVYKDKRTGDDKVSNIRAEVAGIDLVQEYCRTNSLQKILDMPSTVIAKSDKIKFTKKQSIQMEDGKYMKPVDFHDMSFRVDYKTEEDYGPRSNNVKNIVAEWADYKKRFRYINRVRFQHAEYPVFADISIIKSGNQKNHIHIPYYTIQESGTFTNQETFEIEMELDTKSVGKLTQYNSVKSVCDVLRKCIRIVLSGLQHTNYPIGFDERDRTLAEYMKTIHGEEHMKTFQRRIGTGDFIGPPSVTLQIENIGEKTAESNMPNVREHYTVTDKADGERRMMYIAENGRIYMIDTNMNVIFTGTYIEMKTDEKKTASLFNTLIDGEYIKTDRTGRNINLFAAFDVYFVGGKDMRKLGFIPEHADDKPADFRLPILSQLCRKLKPIPIATPPNTGKKAEPHVADSACGLRIECKSFLATSADNSIFDICASLLAQQDDQTFEYTTDGIIFTPSNTGVGASRIGACGPNYKQGWELSFKWKPPKYNTIDFLVTMKKDKRGKDEVHTVFTEGQNLANLTSVEQYKTLILRCGYDETKHGYANPMLNVINDNYPALSAYKEDNYKPVPFQPTNPFDETAYLCNVPLTTVGLQMMTQEGEPFEEDMIVEFSYDLTKPGHWKWVPLRVRYDKTHELRTTGKNFGNAYHVANNNWTSIHNPVTAEMLATGRNIPKFAVNDDVYYNRSTSTVTNTRGLRDFHNLYVKKKLIMGVSRRGDTLIDYAVGKAGDMSKWIQSELRFVFGIDISKDNIQNRRDGACSRYIGAHKKYKVLPDALFVNGTSAQNIRNGDALLSEKDKEITKAVFGRGAKDVAILGKGVYKNYGQGEKGFNISSIQFALHYMFENRSTLHHFVRNVAECTKVDGYFIGTCYDGETVFKLLRSKNEGDSIPYMDGDAKIYEITKRYSQTGFEPDETGLGYAIDVFQDSINKVFREYLVNYGFLRRIMEDYGFVEAGRDECLLPGNTGSFRRLYEDMEDEVDRYPERRADYGDALYMTESERRISFMNRYFVFRKVRNVDTEHMTKVLAKMSKDVAQKYGKSDALAAAAAAEEEIVEVMVSSGKPRKLKIPKVVIGKYEAFDASRKDANEEKPADTARIDEEHELPKPVEEPRKKIKFTPKKKVVENK
jgi:hypothetical protein